MLQFYDTSPPARPYISREGILEKYGEKCNFFDGERNSIGLETTKARASIDPTCFTRNPSLLHSVFIWGDSHAQVLRFGLTEVLPQSWQLLQVASSACAASLAPTGKEYCDVSNRFALDVIARVKPDAVVLAQVSDHNAEKFTEIAARLQSLGAKRIIVVGPTPHWMRPLPWLVVSHLWKYETNKTRAGLMGDSFDTDARLKQAFHASPTISYVSVIDTFCQERDCYYYLGVDRLHGLVSWDTGHLTPIASEFLARSSLARTVVGDYE